MPARFPAARRRRGLSLLEVVVATLVMAVVAVPLFQLFQGGIRATHATIHEVLGANLAAELAEQVETVPFDALAAELVGDQKTYSSRAGTLADRRPLGGADYAFHVSPLPPGFGRSLSLVREDADLLVADIQVEWKIGTLPARRVALRRMLARDSLLP